MIRAFTILLSILFYMSTYGQQSCATAVPWSEQCFFYSSPYPNAITLCYSFSGVDVASFFFLRGIATDPGVPACGDIIETYTLYDLDCNVLQVSVTGLFVGLNPTQTYIVCYHVECPSDGGLAFVCSNEITVLPIELLYFRGFEHAEGVLLKWSTATETRADYFTVERSTNFDQWHQIGVVPASGTSFSTRVYQLIDSEPRNGVNYYRLIEYDYDGLTSTFPVIAVLYKASGGTTTLGPWNILGQRISPY